MPETKRTSEEKKQIAGTILQQLGGNRFIAMTGAKNFLALESGMQCTIGKNKSKVNRLTIELTVMDTYNMKFEKFTPMKVNKATLEYTDCKIELIKQFKDVYCDQLQELFTDVTGMYTRL